MSNIRAAYRLTLASGCVAAGLCAAGITAAPGLRDKRERVAVLWFRSLLRSLNVQLRVEGDAVQGGCLQVANHITWLDIVVLGASGSTRFVSKAEVGDWPIVGRLARAMDTVFLPRGAHQSAMATDVVRQRLSRDEAVVVFPEATTTDGRETRHFYARFFAASIDSRRPVQPIALHYRVPGGDYNAVPYINDMSFGQSLAALLRQPRIEVLVTRRLPIQPQNFDRKTLARVARDSIVVGIAGRRPANESAASADMEATSS